MGVASRSKKVQWGASKQALCSLYHLDEHPLLQYPGYAPGLYYDTETTPVSRCMWAWCPACNTSGSGGMLLTVQDSQCMSGAYLYNILAFAD